MLNDLVEMLTRMGIEPLGKGETGRPERRFTEHRTIEPAPAEPIGTAEEVAGIDLSALRMTADELTAGTRRGSASATRSCCVLRMIRSGFRRGCPKAANDLEKGRLCYRFAARKAILGAEEGDEVELASRKRAATQGADRKRGERPNIHHRIAPAATLLSQRRGSDRIMFTLRGKPDAGSAAE